MTKRQYVSVMFNPWDRRSYTYHNDQEPVAVDDSVVVDTDRGPTTVKVVGIASEAPRFETKPIVGKAEPAPAQAAHDPNCTCDACIPY